MKKVGKKVLFLAWGKTSENEERGASVNRYIGLAACTIEGVNPTKEELSKIYNTDIDQEPSYLSEKDGRKSIRLDFILRTIPEKNDGINLITKASYFLADTAIKSTEGKLQIINSFGETTWATEEEIKAGVIPENVANWFVGPYRVAYSGEEKLVNFLKQLSGIPARTYKNNKGEKVEIADINDAKAGLDEISKYFSGNISEIKNLLNGLQFKRIKVAIGPKTTMDGKIYQDVYTDFPIKYNVTKYDTLSKKIMERKNFTSSEFDTLPLRPYVVAATTFVGKEESLGDLPIGGFPQGSATEDDLDAVFGPRK